jgi:hypothetical protein
MATKNEIAMTGMSTAKSFDFREKRQPWRFSADIFRPLWLQS